VGDPDGDVQLLAASPAQRRWQAERRALVDEIVKELVLLGSTNWAELADREGFIVIWPNGIQNSWNVGDRCCGPAHDQNVDDVGFTRAILDAIQAEACVDARRIYATGCSNGGGMAYDLACRAADVIAAVARFQRKRSSATSGMLARSI